MTIAIPLTTNLLLPLLLFSSIISASLAQRTNSQQQSSPCLEDPIPLDELIHKRKYRIAVHAINGLDNAMRAYNMTFESYLTATAGQRFDPPIEFELVAVDYNSLFDDVKAEEVDFLFANPGSYSCIGVEAGAQPLVTKISSVTARGHSFDLDVFAGVIFTMADNREVNTILDLKDKIIGAGSISVIMGGQTQLYEMVKSDMNYVMDPKQMVFTGNQFDVVEGVLKGDFDVGMVRTGQIENSKDLDGNPLDPEIFRVLEPKIHVLDDGTLFPFLHSTDVYPEWAVAALTFAPFDVSMAVQSALMEISQHAKPWDLMMQCLEEEKAGKEGDNGTTVYEDLDCDAVFWSHVDHCETTPDVSQLAYTASKLGGITGFRSPRSYFEVRTMHEAAGFMLQDEETNQWRCTRANSLQDSLTCPPEHYKLNPEDFAHACEAAGLPCKEGYDCYCKPCVKAFEVDVFQYYGEEDNDSSNSTLISSQENARVGCEKMSLCGTTQQQETIFIRAVDNQKRSDVVVNALMHLGRETYEIPVHQVSDYVYQLDWVESELGVAVLEFFVNGEQIPESPFRIEVIPRDCSFETGGRVPDKEGNCVCPDGSLSIGDVCLSTTFLAVSISMIALAATVIIGYLVVQHKNHINDLVWHVNAEELRFDDPVEVIGEGAFGVVLLAEYRGTKVAIKRALAAGERSRSRAGSRASLELNAGENFEIGSGIMNLDPSSDSDGETPNTDASPDVDMEGQVTVLSLTPNPNKGNRGRSGSFGSGSEILRTRSNTNTFKSKKASVVMDLGFLGTPRRGKRGTKAYAQERFHEAVSMGSSAGSVRSMTFSAKLCPCFDKGKKREQEFVAEMRLLSALRHPCICTVMGAVVSRGYVPMLVMEYMDYGSLQDLLGNETMYLSGDIILQIIRDVAQGMLYLHSAKPPILHGDLKPANILIDSRFRAKVCDFGLSRKKKNTISGSLFWLAPEYLSGLDDYTAACDMYSIGIVVNEIYSRQKPYIGEDADLRSLLLDICDRRSNKRPAMGETIPPKMSALVKKLWSRDPNIRPPAKDLDAILMDMNVGDVEPLTSDQLNYKPRTEDMLYELFPRHIAEALKAGKKIEPETHDLVTIVFSDIKGFTDISREISPMKVSMMLDRLYVAFDKIAKQHGVFKVETIGDAYMGVTNLVQNQEESHVKQIAEFAVDMINEAGQILIDEDEPEKGFIQIRVGFHSGPVVANVIGSLNPRYGLFGDTVNTASRMESNSTGSRILCSEASYLLLKRQAPELPVTERGNVNIKGKGNMTTYWVADELITKNRRALRKSMKVAKSVRLIEPDQSLRIEDDSDYNAGRSVMGESEKSMVTGMKSFSEREEDHELTPMLGESVKSESKRGDDDDDARECFHDEKDDCDQSV